MMFIQNLRIGTKLAVTSALTIGLVALQIYPADERKRRRPDARSGSIAGQQAIAQNATEAKASVRGMQIGIRDILTSSSPAEMQKAVTYFNDRQNIGPAVHGRNGQALALAGKSQAYRSPAVLVGDFGKGEQQIETIRKQELALDAKKDGDAAAQLAKLTAEVDRVRKETLAPINEEISALADQITTFAKQRSHRGARGSRSGSRVRRADVVHHRCAGRVCS